MAGCLSPAAAAESRRHRPCRAEPPAGRGCVPESAAAWFGDSPSLVKRVLLRVGALRPCWRRNHVDARSRCRLHQRACCAEPGTSIVGDDGVGFADDRGVGDVAVIGIVEAVVVVAIFRCVNFEPGNARLSWSNRRCRRPTLSVNPRLPCRPRVRSPAPGGFLIPHGRIGIFGGQLQQEVALKARHKGAGVEDGAVHVGVFRRRGRSPCVSLRRATRRPVGVGVGEPAELSVMNRLRRARSSWR